MTLTVRQEESEARLGTPAAAAAPPIPGDGTRPAGRDGGAA
jgi:hypothetical protein